LSLFYCHFAFRGAPASLRHNMQNGAVSGSDFPFFAYFGNRVGSTAKNRSTCHSESRRLFQAGEESAVMSNPDQTSPL
jgi:hypothetical protein